MALKYALIDADNIIRNIIEYDGVSAYKPPTGLRVQQVEDWLDIGHNANDPAPPPNTTPETQAQILATLAAHRYAIQNNYVSIGGVRYRTDPESRLALSQIIISMILNPAFVVNNYKMYDGSSQMLDKAALVNIWTQGGAFLQACFDTEETLKTNISQYATGNAIIAAFDATIGAYL